MLKNGKKQKKDNAALEAGFVSPLSTSLHGGQVTKLSL